MQGRFRFTGSARYLIRVCSSLNSGVPARSSHSNSTISLSTMSTPALSQALQGELAVAPWSASRWRRRRRRPRNPAPRGRSRFAARRHGLRCRRSPPEAGPGGGARAVARATARCAGRRTRPCRQRRPALASASRIGSTVGPRPCGYCSDTVIGTSSALAARTSRRSGRRRGPCRRSRRGACPGHRR